MKGIDLNSVSPFNSAAAASNIIDLPSGDPSFARVRNLERLRQELDEMFQLPKPDKDKKSVLEEVFGGFDSTVDYCDNTSQINILRHHYVNEFGRQEGEEEVLKDYRDDSVIHKVVDDMPSTYRGRNGAVNAWHDLSSYLQGPLTHFDLTHISVCRNHAQVNWKAECSEPKHMTLYGTDSFTFDDTNHIIFQTTVALSD